jgi:hypothetical protein
MQTSWISCSTSLPRNGESIHFRLDDREVPIDGTYARGVFCSRWSEYDISRVHGWSMLRGAAALDCSQSSASLAACVAR